MPPPLLPQVNSPEDLKDLSLLQLKQLAKEVREETISVVSQTGGHLGASLGVVELTVALHHVFKTPQDVLIWDVGHQSYPHKILTGRGHKMRSLRQEGGLSGFTKRSESPFDPFGTAHAGTSLSAALGFAVAGELKGENNAVIAVIGDGAMSAGMAYEAMNNAGALKSSAAGRLIVILNDNDMSIAPPVGAMSNYLSRLLSLRPYHSLRQLAKEALGYLPSSVGSTARRAEELARNFVTGGTLFEELGFFYIGPVDGHNLDHLIPILQNIQAHSAERKVRESPILLHVVTQKGRGYSHAEAAADKFHGVTKFDVVSGIQAKPSPQAPTFTKVFAQSLVAHAEKDEKIVAITAAMPSGTGLDLFQKAFPNRFFDVGIAEQHAVTFAAGLACEGLKPVVAIYSTFLQRAYDQIVHDVILQKLPVRFAIDRAGLVGADGATHAGSYDLAFLSCLPDIVLMAPADESELVHMMATSLSLEDCPSAFRYPRKEGTGANFPVLGTPLPLGKGRILREGSRVALLSLGSCLQDCLKAADLLAARGLSTTVADARFAKPLDEELITQLSRHHDLLITVEEGSLGGFSTQVFQFLSTQGLLDGKIKVRSKVLPDFLIDHATPQRQYEIAKLTAVDIFQLALEALKQDLETKNLKHVG